MFDKSMNTFPVGKKNIFLSHCAVSPLYKKSAEAIKQFTDSMASGGISSLHEFFDVMPSFHQNGASLFHTTPQNISFIHNTASAMCQIANGYPFQPGDQIISYEHEYPSNHYPWVLQQKRGVELVLLSDRSTSEEFNHIDKPKAWSMDELETMVTDRTRIIAISHVQFTSGYAANLEELGEFCKTRNIDLIVDCAQSLGSLPVYPEQYNIAAVTASGWKWLMGPKGAGILYTSKELREKLSVTMAGPGLMRQGLDYLNHNWAPHDDGRMFEYSTLTWDHAFALSRVIEDVFLKYTIEDIRAEIFRLQNLLLDNLDQSKLKVLLFQGKNRSGILAALPDSDPNPIVEKLKSKGVMVTAPVGYLRFAPHFYQTDEQILTAAKIINSVMESL